MDSILIGTPYFSLVEVSATVNFNYTSAAQSYNVYTDNGLDPVNDPANYIPYSANWDTTIKPDVLSFLSGLPN